jgi:hypothetical protein
MSRLLTFDRLKWASFTHSTVYTVLLVVWLVPDLADLEAVFGMAHGLGWIAMSLACIVALRLRVIDLRLAVAVAVLGGIGPFIGSYEFVRQSRSARRELDDGDADGADDVGAVVGVDGGVAV